MGFHDTWVKIVMRCVTLVTYSIKINGQSRGHITHTRGIRQGNPLSHFLFLFCAEVLLAMIRKSVEKDLLSGVAACPRGHKSHIFSLKMIALFSAEQQLKNAPPLRKSWKPMKSHQANS